MEKIEQLFRQHYSKMFLVSRMILGDEETARDVVSDIFADLLSRKLRLPPKSTEGYFVVLTRNRCLNYLRKMTLHEKVKAGLKVDHTVDIVHDENRIIREIDHEMSKADQMLRFVDEELTLQTRRVVNMHYRQKLTYREISEELDISEAAVYKHLAQGIKRIKEHFNPKNNG